MTEEVEIKKTLGQKIGGVLKKGALYGTIIYAAGVGIDYKLHYDRTQSEIISTLKNQKTMEKNSTEYNKLEDKVLSLEQSEKFFERWPSESGLWPINSAIDGYKKVEGIFK